MIVDMRGFFLLLAMASLLLPAEAGRLEIRVTDPTGGVVPDADNVGAGAARRGARVASVRRTHPVRRQARAGVIARMAALLVGWCPSTCSPSWAGGATTSASAGRRRRVKARSHWWGTGRSSAPWRSR